MTLVQGFKVDENPFFILAEVVINILILADFACRVRLLGVKRFVQGGIWNLFDSLVVLCCLTLFILMLVSKSGSNLTLGEVSEEIMLIIWSLFQTLRMIFIAKKQKQA